MMLPFTFVWVTFAVATRQWKGKKDTSLWLIHVKWFQYLSPSQALKTLSVKLERRASDLNWVHLPPVKKRQSLTTAFVLKTEAVRPFWVARNCRLSEGLKGHNGDGAEDEDAQWPTHQLPALQQYCDHLMYSALSPLLSDGKERQCCHFAGIFNRLVTVLQCHCRRRSLLTANNWTIPKIQWRQSLLQETFSYYFLGDLKMIFTYMLESSLPFFSVS